MATELEYYSKIDHSAYAGEWIAIFSNQIIAHGTDLKKVYAEANEKSKGRRPFFISVPKKEETLIL